MVKAFEDRAQAFEDKRDSVKAKTAKDREEIDQMRAANQECSQQLKMIEAHMVTLVEKVSKLRPQLPPRLSSALDLPLKSLAASNASPAERMQLLITVLNRCAQFNRTASRYEEVLAFEGEPAPRLVQTIYWGLSHGYAWDRTTGKTWFGSPSASGWRWEPCPAAAKSIAALAASFDEKTEPEFIAIPARIGAPGVQKSAPSLK